MIISSEHDWACPSCGHNVASELYKIKSEKKDNWEKQGLCYECGNKNFVKEKEYKRDNIGRFSIGTRVEIQAKCVACGWVDESNVNGKYIKGGNEGKYYSRGQGVKFGLRDIEVVRNTDLN